MYSALEVAQYIITVCTKIGRPISNLRLQKMLYYAQGNVLAKIGEPLFAEDIYAWHYGPVVPEVYARFSVYAGRPIPLTYDTEIEGQFQAEINRIIAETINIPVWNLVEKTHKEAPWKYVYEIYGTNSRIPVEDIKKYFKQSR